jgi:diadenylate cyclase
MALPQQTVALLQSARHLARGVEAEAALILAETHLDWDAVREVLTGCRVFVASPVRAVTQRLRDHDDEAVVIELDPQAAPTQDRLGQALLRAIAAGHLNPGARVVVLYNGIAAEQGRAEPIDSLSVISLDEHLERLTNQDLRKLETRIPLETLRLVVNLAAEIGREGREGKPVGTLLVVGDTRKVLSMARPINFNPFRGYSAEERDLRDAKVREQIKDIAQLDGAIIISRDGIATHACMYLDALADGITLSKGLGARHWAAASISRKTHALAVVVSQSSGTVRLFQNGEAVLHIEPLARPHIWQPFTLGTGEVAAEPPGGADAAV